MASNSRLLFAQGQKAPRPMSIDANLVRVTVVAVGRVDPCAHPISSVLDVFPLMCASLYLIVRLGLFWLVKLGITRILNE